MLLLSPHILLSRTPSFTGLRNNTTSLNTMLPFAAHNMTTAFRMGQLHSQLTSILESHSEENQDTTNMLIASILRQAEILVGRPPYTVSKTDLLNAYDETERVENSVSLITKVRGFFSFVNIIWLLAICGISVAILPTLYHILAPFRKWFLEMASKLFTRVILPLVMRLHSYGIFEIMAYLLCYQFVAEGFRMDFDSGLYVALTGAILVIPAMSYSTMVWGIKESKQMHNVTLLQCLCLWLIACWVPLALHFQSTLLGFGVVIAFFVAIGFDAGIGRLCIFIGFRGDKEIIRVCITSLILTSVFVFVRVCGIGTREQWAPFSCALSTMGSNMLFLSLLILCQLGKDITFYNIVMGILLVLYTVIGFVVGLDSMKNTSLTHLVIWILESYTVFHFKSKFNGWVFLLLISTVLWKVSLFLHQNPQYIITMFTFEY